MANPQIENGYTKIANELFDALCKIRIAGEARQVLDVIIRKTYGYNKKEDKISTSQFMELTGLPHYAIWKARKKLLDMNLITITKKGDSQILTYSIQKDFDKWQPTITKKGVTKKGVTKKATYYHQKSNKTITNMATHKRKKDNIQKKERGSKKTDPRISLCRDFFYKTYKDICGVSYAADFGKDGKLLGAILKWADQDEAIREAYKSSEDFVYDLIDYFFQKAKIDKWLRHKTTIGVMKQQLNSLILDMKGED